MASVARSNEVAQSARNLGAYPGVVQNEGDVGFEGGATSGLCHPLEHEGRGRSPRDAEPRGSC